MSARISWYNDQGERWCSAHQAYHPTKLFGTDRSRPDQLTRSCRAVYLERTLRRRADPKVLDQYRTYNREYMRRKWKDPVYRALHRSDATRRRARLFGAEGSFTAYEWLKLMQFYQGRCLCCGATATSIDHVVPLALGGSNRLENLQPLCLTCNSAKGARHCADYRLVRPTRTLMAAWRKTGLKQDQLAETRLRLIIDQVQPQYTLVTGS